MGKRASKKARSMNLRRQGRRDGKERFILGVKRDDPPELSGGVNKAVGGKKNRNGPGGIGAAQKKGSKKKLLGKGPKKKKPWGTS